MNQRPMKKKNENRQKLIEKVMMFERVKAEKLKERAREKERRHFNEQMVWYAQHGPRTPCSSPPPPPPNTRRVITLDSSPDSSPSTSSSAST